MKRLRIAVCVDRLKMGGSTFSAALIASGLSNRNYETSFVATRPDPGILPSSLGQVGLNILTPCKGINQFRQRLKRTASFLSDYDVIINNHSVETRYVVPVLSESIIRITTIRSIAPYFLITNAVESSRYFDAVVGISPVVCNYLLGAGIQAKVKLISNAVDISTNEFPQLHDECRLLFVGRLENRAKNVIILPSIVSELRRKGINAHLDIIGDGPDMDRLLEEIKKSDCSNVIDVHGICSRLETNEYLSRSNFIVVPSYYEGFGRVVAEGMATGCIPITSNIEVFKWLLGKYASRLQCSKSDYIDYADRIVKLFGNKDVYIEIQKYLRNRQKSNFSPKNTIEGYSNLIKDIMSQETRPIQTRRRIETSLQLRLKMKYSLPYAFMSLLWKKLKNLG